MKVQLIKDLDYINNDKKYFKGEILEVTKLELFENYACYYIDGKGENTVDWIPKSYVELL